MSTIKANTLLAADGTTTTQPSIPALDQRMAKAWVNFAGTNIVTIRDSYNVSSLTDNGVGAYTINFTNALSTINSAMAGSAGDNTSTNLRNVGVSGAGATTSRGISVTYASGSSIDALYINVIVFGD